MSLVLWLWTALAFSHAQQPLPALTRAVQIRNLPPAQAELGYPVKFDAVVTFCDGSRKLLFVQDATGGIFVNPQREEWPWRSGEKVSITGISARGSHLPYVNNAILQLLGTAPLPAHHSVTLRQVATDSEDANWVEVSGIVRSAVIRDNNLRLDIVADGYRLQSAVMLEQNADINPKNLLDTEVRIEGVAGELSKDPASSTLMELHVPGLAHIKTEWAPNESSATQFSLAQLPSLFPLPDLVHRIRVKGSLRVSADRSLELSDTNGRVLVQPTRPIILQSNSSAEILGFPAGTPEKIVLEDAQVRFFGLSLPETATNIANAVREELPVLTEAQAIRDLPANEAHRGYPVKISGVVTYADPTWKYLFVQDETAGIFVWGSPVVQSDMFGKNVVLAGFSGEGLFAPIIRNPHIEVGQNGSLPPPKFPTQERLQSGEEDSQRVEVRGTIHFAVIENNHLSLQIHTSAGVVYGCIPGFQTNNVPEYLIDAEVRAAGVSASIVNKEKQLTGIQLLIAGINDVQVIKPAPVDPFALPVTPIENLLQWHLQRDLRHRIHIRGTVTYRDPQWCTLFVEDRENAVYVRSLREPTVNVGDVIDVVGFVQIGKFKPTLSEAIFRPVGPGTPPSPIQATPSQAVSGEYDGRLVTLQARLVEHVRGTSGRLIHLQGEQWSFLAHLEGTQDASELNKIPEGSLLRVTGICSLEGNLPTTSAKLCLRLRSHSDVVILEQPSRWTPRRFFTVLAIMAAILTATVGWIWLLRRSVRRQTATIRAKLERESTLEAQYRELFENVTDLIQSFHPDGSVEYVNPAWLQALGYSASEARTLTLRDVVHPDDLPRFLEFIERPRQGDHPSPFEARFRRQNGQFIQVEGSCSAGPHDGKGSAIRGIFRDVTERKRSEAALLQSEAQLAAIYDNTPIMMYVLNERREVERMNRAMTAFVGKDAIDNLPAPQGNFLGCANALNNLQGCGGSVQCVTCPLRLSVEETFKTGRSCQRVEKPLLLAQNGIRREVWISGSTALVRMEGNPKVLVCLEDITERRHLERQFLHAQKMEAIGQLAGGVAHDFNNILAAMMMNLGLLRQNQSLDPETVEGLADLEKDAQRAASLTRQLLLFGRRQAMDPKLLDLNTLVVGLTKMLKRLLGEHIEMTVVSEVKEMWVHADSGMLEQLIVNLCVNARDAMPKGGRLTLNVSQVTVAPEHVEQHGEARIGRFVRLTVTDTGVGMDAATLKRIFEPFFTTKEVGKGTGLGLATVYGIAKQHQGWIEVDSAVGQWTTFSLYLPAAQTPSPMADHPAEARSEHHTILLVEGDASSRTSTATDLRKGGYEVLEARNSIQALNLWEEHGMHITLLVTDVVMPEGASGLELAERLRQLKPVLKVIVTSEYHVNLTNPTSATPTGFRFVAKPYQSGKLASIARELLG